MNIYDSGTCTPLVDEVTAPIKIGPLCMEIKRDEDYHCVRKEKSGAMDSMCRVVKVN